MARKVPWVRYAQLPERAKVALRELRRAHEAGESAAIDGHKEAFRFAGGAMWFPRATVHGPSPGGALGAILGTATLLALIATVIGFAQGLEQRWLIAAALAGLLAVGILSHLWDRRAEGRARRELAIGVLLLDDLFLAGNGTRFRVVERGAVRNVDIVIRKVGGSPDTRIKRRPILQLRDERGELTCPSGFENNPEAEAILSRWAGGG